MKKMMRQKIPKYRSKKGMTLVELLAGVVIIVIVFGATLSAMTNGFAVTLHNAATNQYAVEGESVNEIILQAISKQEFSDGADARLKIEANNNPIDVAAKSVVPGIKYVKYEDFESSSEEDRYTVKFDAKTTVSSAVLSGRKQLNYAISGMEITTHVTSSTGVVRNTSFVAYADQSGS